MDPMGDSVRGPGKGTNSSELHCKLRKQCVGNYGLDAPAKIDADQRDGEDESRQD